MVPLFKEKPPTFLHSALLSLFFLFSFFSFPFGRPFRMASCSRDTTIRVWSLASYAGPWIVSSFNGNVKYGESDSRTPLKDQQQKMSGKLQSVFHKIRLF